MIQVTEKVKEEKRWDGEDTVAIKYRATEGAEGQKSTKTKTIMFLFTNFAKISDCLGIPGHCLPIVGDSLAKYGGSLGSRDDTCWPTGDGQHYMDGCQEAESHTKDYGI